MGQNLNLFNGYEWKSLNECNHNKKMVENHRVFKFLVGLNIEFDEVMGRIIGTLPSLAKVFSKVRRQESCRSVIIRKKVGNLQTETLALIVDDANVNKSS